MFNFLNKPEVILKIENPGWICGRQLTWLNIRVNGFCHVSLKSNSHNAWQPVSKVSTSQFETSIVVPIGSTLIVKTWSLRGRENSTFDVNSADWAIDPPLIAAINNNFAQLMISQKIKEICNQLSVALKLLQVQLNKTRSTKETGIQPSKLDRNVPKFEYKYNKLIQLRRFNRETFTKKM